MNLPLNVVSNFPNGIDLGFFTLRYYSLMFVVAFGLGYYIMKKIFIREGESMEKLDSILIWTAIATLLGARLGQVFFYEWGHFQDHPEEILLPIRRLADGSIKFTGFTGLASHGAAIAILIAMYFFSKKIMKRSFLWCLDRVVIPVASGGIFVRLGNFFNSEIYGKPTSPDHWYAVKFVRGDEFWDNKNVLQLTQSQTENEAFNKIAHDPQYVDYLNAIPFRHPAQLYEAFLYIFVFAVVFSMYWKTEARKKEGLIFGVFLILLWSVRFIVEFVKASQGGFEGDHPILSTGQWLSIPFILVGIWLVFWAKEKTAKQKHTKA